VKKRKEKIWHKDYKFKSQYFAEFQKNKLKIHSMNIFGGIINVWNELGVKYTIKKFNFNKYRLKKLKKNFPGVKNIYDIINFDAWKSIPNFYFKFNNRWY